MEPNRAPRHSESAAPAQPAPRPAARTVPGPSASAPPSSHFSGRQCATAAINITSRIGAVRLLADQVFDPSRPRIASALPTDEALKKIHVKQTKWKVSRTPPTLPQASRLHPLPPLLPNPYRRQRDAMQRSPYKERPAQPMPQSAQHHRHDHAVAVREQRMRPPPLRQRVHDVVPQPLRERDVPPPPELHHIHRQIRLPEVLRNASTPAAAPPQSQCPCSRRSRKTAAAHIRTPRPAPRPRCTSVGVSKTRPTRFCPR